MINHLNKLLKNLEEILKQTKTSKIEIIDCKKIHYNYSNYMIIIYFKMYFHIVVLIVIVNDWGDVWLLVPRLYRKQFKNDIEQTNKKIEYFIKGIENNEN